MDSLRKVSRIFLHKVSTAIGLKRELSPSLHANITSSILLLKADLEYFPLDVFCKKPIEFCYKNVKKHNEEKLDNNDRNLPKIISDEVLPDRGFTGVNKKW